MTTRIFVSAVSLLLVLGVASPPAQAATPKEALKCGLALRKLQAKQLVLLSKAIVKLCKEPGDLAEVVTKMTAALNKTTQKINAKFNAGNCDPDIAQLGGLPQPLLSEAAVEGLVVGVTTPLAVLCNNTSDAP
jgi:hypothetical protein